MKRYQTVLVSDAGAKIKPEEEPKQDWPRHAYRVLDLIDNQVRSLRKRALIASYQAKPDDPSKRQGAYWGIGTNYSLYSGRALKLSCAQERIQELASVATRLKRMDDDLQERLINWGYAVTDAALRSYVDPKLNQPKAFPIQVTVSEKAEGCHRKIYMRREPPLILERATRQQLTHIRAGGASVDTGKRC